MISLESFLVFLSMLGVTYSTRLMGFFALRNRTLSQRAASVMQAASVYMFLNFFIEWDV